MDDGDGCTEMGMGLTLLRNDKMVNMICIVYLSRKEGKERRREGGREQRKEGRKEGRHAPGLCPSDP